MSRLLFYFNVGIARIVVMASMMGVYMLPVPAVIIGIVGLAKRRSTEEIIESIICLLTGLAFIYLVTKGNQCCG